MDQRACRITQAVAARNISDFAMPELPEVETIARGLDSRIVGRTIQHAHVGWRRSVAVPSPDLFVQRIACRRVVSVGRRGKYIVAELDMGWLLIHLKMSGRLLLIPSTEPSDAHTHIILGLDDGWDLRFHDVRKFGRLYLLDDPVSVTGSLGPEPLDESFSLVDFRRLLGHRSGRLKSLLLNQEFLAGIGNIYADEALFSSRLHPLRKADSLTWDEQSRLYLAIRTVLGRAVAGRGTTLEDSGYVDAEGRSGGYQDEIAVYGRSGKPCRHCGAAVERIVVGGRSAHFCPACQSIKPEGGGEEDGPVPRGCA